MSNILDYINEEPNQLFYTNYQKILRYLVNHPRGEYIEKDIQNATSISKAGVNFALRDLTRDGLINAKKKGRMSLYSVSLDNPLIRQVKVLLNLIEIGPLVLSLQELSEKVVLFGSTSTGLNVEDSDIDIFVLTNEPNEVRDATRQSPLADRIQLVAMKPVDYAILNKKDKVFYEELSRGLTIWEKKNE